MVVMVRWSVELGSRTPERVLDSPFSQCQLGDEYPVPGIGTLGVIEVVPCLVELASRHLDLSQGPTQMRLIPDGISGHAQGVCRPIDVAAEETADPDRVCDVPYPIPGHKTPGPEIVDEGPQNRVRLCVVSVGKGRYPALDQQHHTGGNLIRTGPPILGKR